jgi:uncharacterized protein YchJ
MDTRSIEIIHLDDNEGNVNQTMFNGPNHPTGKRGNKLVPLTKELAEYLESNTRKAMKNKMNNVSCVCGSGKKFKRCCKSKYR